MINRNPVYLQLSDELRELIRSGRLGEGDRFLTEREVSQRFDVSRTTANKVIAGLVSEGVLNIRKGVGTFVNRTPLTTDMTSLISFTDKARKAGCRPETKVLEFRKADAETDGIMREKSLYISNNVYFFRRLRLAGKVPVILERRYLFLNKNYQISEKELEGSLYSLLTDKYGISVSSVDQDIRAVAAAPDAAALLEIDTGSPLLLINASAKDADNMPVWFEETLYRSDMYSFANRMEALQNGIKTGLIAGLRKKK